MEFSGRFRKALFRLGDEPGAPVLLQTFLQATPAQGNHVTIKDIEGNVTRYEVQDVTFELEAKATGGEDSQEYYEPTIYVDLMEV